MIVNDEQRLAMEFIATVNRGGYRPTAREINQWRLQPDPKAARKGKLLEPEVPTVPERRVRTGGASPFDNLFNSSAFKNWNLIGESLTKQLSGISAMQLAGLNSSVMQAMAAVWRTNALSLPGVEYKTIPGKPGKPAVYGPDEPPEKFLAHLRRLGWIERNTRGRYSVTLLGQALLDADIDDAQYEDSSVIVLAKENELAYAKVLGTIGGCGDAFVVDAYLSAEALSHILAHTNATRFLVNHKYQANKATELSVLVTVAQPNDDGVVRELRRADFHDRYLIGEDKTYGLTASLNGVGKSMALLMEMPDTAARAIRAEVEELWNDGEVLARGLELAAPEEAEPASRVIREEGGKFLHDGCDVKHRSEQAAENCTKGT